MPKRVGTYTLQMENRPCILGFAAVVGKKESEGPLASYFDRVYADNTLEEDSWEKAESRMQQQVVQKAACKQRQSPWRCKRQIKRPAKSTMCLRGTF